MVFDWINETVKSWTGQFLAGGEPTPQETPTGTNNGTGTGSGGGDNLSGARAGEGCCDGSMWEADHACAPLPPPP